MQFITSFDQMAPQMLSLTATSMPGPSAVDTSMAKLWISEAMMRASYTGMQVLGGYGYTLDSNMQLHWRNARLGTIGTGSSEIQRNIIARQIGLGGRPS